MANVIIGTGSYLPERVVTNQEIEKWGVDYEPARSGGLSLEQWGQSHLGGASRHWVAATAVSVHSHGVAPSIFSAVACRSHICSTHALIGER
jgi:3-oxoacyl-[acyl-carrier-protein] synthase III